MQVALEVSLQESQKPAQISDTRFIFSQIFEMDDVRMNTKTYLIEPNVSKNLTFSHISIETLLFVCRFS